ncbi:MAG: PQQ-binding-like beta-propeller repeat protein [bacterium]|nr:PQQ-binding-like beta-propeller repeat protein [bacterium]
MKKLEQLLTIGRYAGLGLLVGCHDEIWVLERGTGPKSCVVWEQTYGGSEDDIISSVKQTADGGFVVAGYTSSSGAGSVDGSLMKTDADGNMLWEKTYGGTKNDYLLSVQQTNDENYIWAGYTDSFGAGMYDILLMKTDAEGNILWKQTYGGSDSDAIRSVQQTNDGEYIVAGSTRSSGAGGSDSLLMKIDADGNMQWEQTYGGSDDDKFFFVQQTTDGGYIATGHTFSSGAGESDSLLMKTDADGNMLWEKTYGGTKNDYLLSVQQTIDEGYVVAGHRDYTGTGSGESLLMKIDADGNMQWEQTYGESIGETFSSVQQTNDEGYIVAGHTGYDDNELADSWLMKTDASGKKLWEQTLGGKLDDGISSVLQTTDGGFVGAGYTASSGAGNYDGSLVKACSL